MITSLSNQPPANFVNPNTNKTHDGSFLNHMISFREGSENGPDNGPSKEDFCNKMLAEATIKLFEIQSRIMTYQNNYLNHGTTSTENTLKYLLAAIEHLITLFETLETKCGGKDGLTQEQLDAIKDILIDLKEEEEKIKTILKPKNSNDFKLDTKINAAIVTNINKIIEITFLFILVTIAGAIKSITVSD